jgi:hypothetical protein
MLLRTLLVRWRFVRLKLSHWLALFTIAYRYLVVRDVDFSIVHFRFRLALGKTNFKPVYEMLDDLIKFPPY